MTSAEDTPPGVGVTSAAPQSRELLPGLGPSRQVPANDRLVLDDPLQAWIVTVGEVRVFAVERIGGEPLGVSHPLFTCQQGNVMFGTAHDDLPVTLVVAGTTADAEASPIQLAALRALIDTGAAPTIVASVEAWTRSMASSVRDIGYEMRDDDRQFVHLGPRDVAQVPAGAVVMPRGRGVWLRCAEHMTLFGSPAAGIVPLPPYTWAEMPDSGLLETCPGEIALSTEAGWEGLLSFFAAVVDLLGHRVENDTQEEIGRQTQLEHFEDELSQAVFTDLGNVVTGNDSLSLMNSVADHVVLEAVTLVARASGITVVEPPASVLGTTDSPLEVIARTSGFRTRKVAMTKNWWRQDGGPLLGQLEDDGPWIALLPERHRRYTAVLPGSGERHRVTAEYAKRVSFDAYQLYRPLPLRPLSGRDLFRYIWQDVRVDTGRVAATALAIGALSVVPTFAAKIIFSSSIPRGDQTELIWIAALMLIAATVAGLFSLHQGISSLRVETRASLGVQAAVFSRLLDLPTTFYRRFASADLAVRAMGIETMRETLSQYTVATLLGAVAGSCNLIVMFAIEPVLALFGALSVGAAVWVMVVAFRTLSARQLEVQEAQGQLYSLGVQLLGAIVKLRVADAERRAFAQWAGRFTTLKRCELRSSRAQAAVTTFFVAFLPLATAPVMLGATVLGANSVSAGSFIAFNTAFTVVVASLVAMGATTSLVAATSPLYHRMRPILEAQPEAATAKPDPGRLRGAVEVSAVSFRYEPDSPLVLEDVTFVVEPGEMVAIVGPSGSGKSSLLRLLLGFERPETGVVSYDNHDLHSVDVRAVRRQCGVVIQGTRLMPGDLRYNIVGTRRLTLDDAWRAAETAGVDEYIRELPMGMDTVVSEQGGAFSGGQRQLLLLARAIAGRPRIILLDEATSALDNANQANVMANIESLNATRIVIAHRLSTIRRADRILVLDAGRLVQTGTFSELTERPGPFLDLVQRQTL